MTSSRNRRWNIFWWGSQWTISSFIGRNRRVVQWDGEEPRPLFGRETHPITRAMSGELAKSKNSSLWLASPVFRDRVSWTLMGFAGLHYARRRFDGTHQPASARCVFEWTIGWTLFFLNTSTDQLRRTSFFVWAIDCVLQVAVDSGGAPNDRDGGRRGDQWATRNRRRRRRPDRKKRTPAKTPSKKKKIRRWMPTGDHFIIDGPPGCGDPVRRIGPHFHISIFVPHQLVLYPLGPETDWNRSDVPSYKQQPPPLVPRTPHHPPHQPKSPLNLTLKSWCPFCLSTDAISPLHPCPPPFTVSTTTWLPLDSFLALYDYSHPYRFWYNRLPWKKKNTHTPTRSMSSFCIYYLSYSCECLWSPSIGYGLLSASFIHSVPARTGKRHSKSSRTDGNRADKFDPFTRPPS